MGKTKNTRKTGDELAERLLDFAVLIIKLVNALPKTAVGRYIGGQLLRSGASPGANYEEARGAESRADFIHKMGIVLKELKESRFWLRLIHRTKLMKADNVVPATQECQELCSIIAKNILTARKNK